jgi:hypothetical protein
VADTLGWCGGILAAVAYVMVARGRLAPTSVWFHALNIVGAALLAVAAFDRGALPSASMNVLWIVFGAVSVAASVTRSGTGVPRLTRRPSPRDQRDVAYARSGISSHWTQVTSRPT